jgi:dienelactone hydrolase
VLVASGGAGGIASASGGVSSSDASANGGSTTGGDAGADSSADGPTPVPPPTPTGCVAAAALTPGVHQVTCDTTVHVLTVPEACTKTACGVIVDVHGGMMSSQMEDKNTNLSALGVKHGYLVIQPNALQNPILLNQRLFVADAPGTPGDDTRVMNILTQVIAAFHADTKRVHMTGFSEGGFMTWRWFCKHPDMLASVAPGAAAWKCATLANLGLTPPEIGCEFTGTDVPARNVPVLFMQGTKDGLVEPPCVDAWLKANVFPTLKLDAGTKIAGDTTFTRTRYLDPSGVPFEYISHDYATTSSFLGVALVGHCYPGSTDLTVTPPAQTVIPPDQIMSFGCNDQTSFNWGEEVMKFFIAHPKR